MNTKTKHNLPLPLLLFAAIVLRTLGGILLGAATTAARNSATPWCASPRPAASSNTRWRPSSAAMSIPCRRLARRTGHPAAGRGARPHSVYIPREEMQRINEPLDGEFDGIGIVFNMVPDTVVVLNVIAGGPSDRAGLRSGDRIVRIDDSLVAGRQIPQPQVVRMLRGERGTRVRLTLPPCGHRRFGSGGVVRDAIPIKSIEAAFMLTDDIGFIRLGQFARTSLPGAAPRHAPPADRGHAQADLRPAGQRRRLPRPGHHDRQRVPARGTADRLYRGSPRRAGARVRRRHGFGERTGGGGAHRRGQRFVERDSGRGVAGQRPRHDHRPPLLRQGPSCSSRYPMPTVRPCG